MSYDTLDYTTHTKLPCRVRGAEPALIDGRYLVLDATGTVVCMSCDFTLATLIRDALNRPYFYALAAAKDAQSMGRSCHAKSRLSYDWCEDLATGCFSELAVEFQNMAREQYAKARDILGIVE